MEKAAKRKCLVASHLEQWAGAELNRRHTDFQSSGLRITPFKSMTYIAFSAQKRGLQLVNKWNYKRVTSGLPLATDAKVTQIQDSLAPFPLSEISRPAAAPEA
jgi:hypothetical protein